jgi:hypothetical protein
MSNVPWVWRRSCSRDAGAAGDSLEGLRDGVGVDRSAFGVGEHPSGMVDADGVVFGGF